MGSLTGTQRTLLVALNDADGMMLQSELTDATAYTGQTVRSNLDKLERYGNIRREKAGRTQLVMLWTPATRPKHKLLDALEDAGGVLEQQELIERTSYSRSTVSENLGELEDAGAVGRHPIGKGKMVWKAGKKPDSLARWHDGNVGGDD